MRKRTEPKVHNSKMNRRWGVFAFALLVMTMWACAPGDTEEITKESSEVHSSIEMETMLETTMVKETSAEEETTDILAVPSQVVTGDWNEDGQQDRLELYEEEMEGSSYLTEVRLYCDAEEPWILEVMYPMSFEDVLSGDFDGDQENELVVLFDIHAVGANGGCGLYMLDQVNGQWMSVPQDDLFIGFSYDVVYDKSEKTFKVSGQDSGQEYWFPWDADLMDPDHALGRVTPFYRWSVVEDAEMDHITLWQYVAGEFTSDYLGDMVITICLEEGRIHLEEEIAVLP